MAWFDKSDDELSALYPVPNTARALSRSGRLLGAITVRAKPYLERHLAEDPFSIGIYCAIEQGPIGFSSIQQLRETDENFAEKFKRHFSPKQYLKHLPSVAAACPGIFLGIKGPVQVFNHSVHAVHHAIDQAEADLRSSRVKAAYVCTANSLEDPLIAIRNQDRIPASRTLTEGAAFVVITPGDVGVELHDEYITGESGAHYGIADPLIQAIRKRRNGR